MAFILADRVKETASAPGTGTVTLLGAASGYQSFSAGVGASNTTYYTIADQTGTNWEVGYGTIGAGGTTLARTTVLASSNSGSLVNFSSGTQDVWCDYPAKKAVSLDSAGAIRAGSNPYIDFEDGNGTTVAAGRMWYGASEGNWNLGMGGGNITQQVGEELFVYGKASAAITDSPLQIVYHTGTVGASGVITFAPTIAGITDENAIVGVATENIALNGFGRVTTFGVVRGITTNGTAFGETWADDDVIWYNPVTGNPTKVKPSAPNIKFQIGTVIKAGSGGSGSFQVNLVQGTALGGTDSNVKITSVTNGNLLTYDGGNGYWKNTDLTAGTGISVSKSANGVLTVTNTSPSSGGTVTSVTGTAPVVSSGGATPAISMAAANTTTNGYLTSTDWNTFNNKGSGTVTSVSATSPVTSTGGATPTIAMPAATTSVSGYLTSTDWTTFNNKGSGTVTSVTGTSPVVSSGGATPAISMAAATGSVNGYLTSTDWTTFNNKGSGTVTSVGLSAPSIFTVGSSPVTSSGTLALTYSGTALPAVNGGTAQTTYATGDIIYASATNTLSKLAAGTNGYVLTLASGVPSWAAASGGGSNITSLGLWENSATISANYTIGTGNNAQSAGPITVNTGVTVTVPTGSTWVIV
jgi:hypothetical protein